MSTAKVINIVHPSGSVTNIVNDASGNVAVGNNLTVAGTSTISGNETVTGTLVMGSSFKRNRIINGNMVVDQRNAGAQISAANLTSGTYMVDRFQYFASQASKFTAQQNAGAVTPPTGFSNYLGMTVASAVSVGASDYFTISEAIEGFNFADLGFGTASAKTVTLSFAVYSSLTGTFGGALKNFALTRSYPFSYTIPTANTWTTISVTVAGDTSGTWVGATNAGAAIVQFGLGLGSSNSATAGAWAAGNYSSATGAVSVVGTSGATFYVTGVQLEVGTKATPYEMQIYSDQLAQCQRYFFVTANNITYQAYTTAGQNAYYCLFFPVQMRTAPTISSNITSTNCTSTPSSTAQNIVISVSIASTTAFLSNYLSGNTASAEL